ncbi:2-amino-4-hydroxy-6-hydroxymethyldihydropteridine diphosphokinase [Flavobacterium crassostreae]|uniref:2-amino-4-hydroxy-6-hydroxymethyldihydropteridine pyrophosphokinase n=1 Tax=Flavobacterium crassostreae TaxID=1763534 RepID=A0A1B9DXL7_9FLAO|nr:2-amino-4-hydroxy-6-hydroxymethyldihydropteridine diphosphokinase [Flavobacterium crassostreae]OCB74430.1 7,8-dihydro-6-hydroxymethylpterin-pyrophosphokinase [Flavobacterium crassostreae]
MKVQHQVILSIGSNQGNRLENIENSIKRINQSLGTVVGVSALYESASWGFDSSAFYNCALLVHTFKTAEQILDQVLKIEKELGRLRKNSPGYAARLIDIDLIFVDQQIINTDQLQLPHPLLEQRNFVLYPVADLAPQWKHPVLQKTIQQLVAASADQSVCKAISKLYNPTDEMPFKQAAYVVIEGNIGAGKSTLVTKIAQDFDAKAVLERFADNPFLPKFYQDPDRYAFSLEVSFLADRHQQLATNLAQLDLSQDFVVADYHVLKSLLFAKITLADLEYQLYKDLFGILCQQIPKPDLYVYLHQSSDQLLHNIKKRGREYEQNITKAYLDKVNQGYLDYIHSQTDWDILILDISNKDFVKNQEDYWYVLEQINQKLATVML